MADTIPGEKESIEDFKRRVLLDTKTIIRYADEPGPSDSRSAIKRLFSKLLDDLSIGERSWNRLMDYYLRDPINGIANNSEEHVQTRSSLNKNFISNDSMTWVMFVRAMRFLRVVRFCLRVTLVHSNGTTSEHGIWLNVRNEYQPLEEEDDPQRSFNRVPTLQVRSEDEIEPGVIAGSVSEPRPIQAPQAVDIAGWRRNTYPSTKPTTE